MIAGLPGPIEQAMLDWWQRRRERGDAQCRIEPALPLPPPSARPVPALPWPVEAHAHVSTFLRAAIAPRADRSMSLRDLHQVYLVWCRDQRMAPLGTAELGRALGKVIEALGLPVEEVAGDILVHGAVLHARRIT